MQHWTSRFCLALLWLALFGGCEPSTPSDGAKSPSTSAGRDGKSTNQPPFVPPRDASDEFFERDTVHHLVLKLSP
ncbi:MAG: hypothetical protein NT069_00455, partial [Planctomycetota bacterium]|nr:hypothetical protein [Planctomycetota bacterium]